MSTPRAPNPVARFAVNFTVYAVLGGGLFAYVSMQAPAAARPSFTSVVIAALCLAVWGGALTTITEMVTVSETRQGRRTLVAGVLGALSLGGFAAILSLLAWRGLPLGFIAVAVVAGGAMHAARAFARGGPPPGDEESDDDGDDEPGRDLNPPSPR